MEYEAVIELLWITFIVLFGLTLLLIVSSLYMRWNHGWIEARMDVLAEKFYPYIFGYIEGEYSSEDILKLFSGDEFEYDVFEKIIKDLLNDTEGEDKDQLRKLLTITPLFDMHLKQLVSRRESTLIKACSYFQFTRLVNYKVIVRLKALTTHKNRRIVFIAASALMASKEVKNRLFAIRMIVNRDRISEMAVLEMLYKFKNPNIDQTEKEAIGLRNMILNEEIPPDNLSLLIMGASELRYDELSDLFFELLQNENEKWNSTEVKKALIYAQGQFARMESVPWLKDIIENGDSTLIFPSLRVLARLGGEEIEDYLLAKIAPENPALNKMVLKALLENGYEEDMILNQLPNYHMGLAKVLINHIQQNPT